MMRKIHPFALGSIAAGLVTGGVAGSAALALHAIVLLALGLGAGAGIAALVCWRWPGLSAAAWKLWPMAVITNPLFMAGVYWTIDKLDCVLSRARSWDCMFADFGPILAGLCLIPPTAGLVVRFVASRFPAFRFLSPDRGRG